MSFETLYTWWAPTASSVPAPASVVEQSDALIPGQVLHTATPIMEEVQQEVRT